MEPDFRPAASTRKILLLDRDSDAAAPLRQALAPLAVVEFHHELGSLLSRLQSDESGFLTLLDTATLRDSPTGLVSQVADLRSTRKMGLVTGQNLEEYIGSLRQWGVLQCAVKVPPHSEEELEHFLLMLENPLSGFGLIRFLSSTIQMFSVSISTIPTKVQAIERVINHFATCGFEVHELYDVRLILEEITNNAFFHAFHTASGEEKYSITDFHQLEPTENVRIEYGSDGSRVGFSVTDSAGTLPIPVILGKIERQLNREGIFDESGRGLYLSRMLATKLILNIEQGKRTQVIALFDDSRKGNRPKPFIINYVGRDTFAEWRSDPDFD